MPLSIVVNDEESFMSSAGDNNTGKGRLRTSLNVLCGLMAVTCCSTYAVAADSDAAKDDLEEVVVTGSRVIANGNDSPTPVTVLSADELLQANPGNVVGA